MKRNYPVVITEPAAVAALKEIYQNNGPGDLEWDFSTLGQVTARDDRLKAQDGALTGLNLNRAELKGTLKLRGVETLTVLTAEDNNLCGIDLEDLPGLRELTLNDNQIRDMPSLAGLKNLKFLSCSRNQLPVAEVLKWICFSAEHGDKGFQLVLGDLNNYGRPSVEKDMTEAVKWFRLAAEQGDSYSQYYLGRAYYKGEGVEEDKAEAVKWFRLAAEQALAEAQFELGHAYGLGEGVAHDKAEADKWFRLAAKQGHAEAQFELDYSAFVNAGGSHKKI